MTFPAVWRFVLDAEVEELRSWLQGRAVHPIDGRVVRCHYDFDLCVRDKVRQTGSSPQGPSCSPIACFDAEWKSFVRHAEAIEGVKVYKSFRYHGVY